MLDQLEKLKEGKENNECNLAKETTNAVSPISPIVRSPFRESNRQSSDQWSFYVYSNSGQQHKVLVSIVNLCF